MQIDTAAAFTPFDESEVRRMVRYRERVDQLKSRGFNQQTSHSFTIAAPGKTPLGDEDKERLIAALPYFRKVDGLNDDATFKSIRKLLSASAHHKHTPDAAKAGRWLTDLKTTHSQLQSKSSLLKYIRGEPPNQVTVTPATVIRLFMYGEVIHDDPKLAHEFENGGWNDPALVMILSAFMSDMILVFRLLDAVVSEVLSTPSLRPAP